MKFAKAALSLFLLSRAASAWTTAARPLLQRRNVLATQFHASTTIVESLTTEVVGEEKTESFRLAFKDGSTAISPWHDIPLKNEDGSYNMVSRYLSIESGVDAYLCAYFIGRLSYTVIQHVGD